MVEMAVAQQDGGDVGQRDAAAADIVRQGMALAGVEKERLAVVLDEGGKAVFPQEVHPADVVVTQDLNGGHVGLP